MSAKDIAPEISKQRAKKIKALIHKSKHTTAEIVDILNHEFPMFLPESHQSLISHNKNPKYNDMGPLIIEDSKTGILSFSR